MLGFVVVNRMKQSDVHTRHLSVLRTIWNALTLWVEELNLYMQLGVQLSRALLDRSEYTAF